MTVPEDVYPAEPSTAGTSTPLTEPPIWPGDYDLAGQPNYADLNEEGGIEGGPSITLIAPDTAFVDDVVVFTITGTGLADTTSVGIEGTEWSAANAPTSNTDTEITVMIDFTGAAHGSYQLRIRQAGEWVLSVDDAITVE